VIRPQPLEPEGERAGEGIVRLADQSGVVIGLHPVWERTPPGKATAQARAGFLGGGVLGPLASLAGGKERSPQAGFADRILDRVQVDQGATLQGDT